VPPVFIRDDSVEARQMAALKNFLDGIEHNIEALVPDSMKMRRLRDFLAAQPQIMLSDEGLRFLLHGFARGPRPFSAAMPFKNYSAQLQRIARDFFAVGILSLERSALPAYVRKISLLRGVDEMVEPVEQFSGMEAEIRRLAKVARNSQFERSRRQHRLSNSHQFFAAESVSRCR
jgi:hypothetical protein